MTQFQRATRSAHCSAGLHPDVLNSPAFACGALAPAYDLVDSLDHLFDDLLRVAEHHHRLVQIEQ
ncbi:hypothetical protein, partial [Pandoraea apista]|uniref:hypothetical protein n=1 Tax=Pandoraea apista TaxID=93218 RepID=UPI002F949A07